MLTENTKNSFLCVELVDETRHEDYSNVLNELADLVSKRLGGTAKLYILDVNNREVEI
jgi:DNA/RNA-binding domain of Phe-tRNA-synthetase-like protein